MNDLCFVVTSDAVYREVVERAVVAAGLEPVRHADTFERLVLCRFAVVDLTNADASLFYQLGVREAVRPGTTVLIVAEGREPLLGAIPYAGVTKALLAAKENRGGDAPLRHLLDDYPFPAVAHLKTDLFQEAVADADERHRALGAAKEKGRDAVKQFEESLGDLDRVDFSLLLDLFLSYRAVKAWDAMIDLAGRMPAPLRFALMTQEQLAFALNRAGRGEEAEAILLDLIERHGPSSETYALLGRVYKDRGDTGKAIDAYRKGFEADWRDAYPGINAVTLMELQEPPDPHREVLLPVVRYAATRRVESGQPDYWDYATLLEIALLMRNESEAREALAKALPLVRASWEPESTAGNLRLIAEARRKRNDDVPWSEAILSALDDASR